MDVIKRRFYSYEHETREVLDELRKKVVIFFYQVMVSILLRKSAQNPHSKKRTSFLLILLYKCVVQMTLTTWDERLCGILEPNVCNTQRRVEVLDEMRKRGIPTVVWLAPILPFINDTEENVTAILEACARVQVKGIICFDMGLTLREGDREYYYAALDRHFPGLKEKYIRTYGNAYEVPSPDSGKLMTLFRSFCRDHGMMYKPDECFEYMGRLPEKFEQISFLDGQEQP